MSEQTTIDNDSEALEPESRQELVAEPVKPESRLPVINHPFLKGLARLPITHQLGLMLGLALSVAIGVSVVLWSQEPIYGRLYSEVPEKDMGEIIDYLNAQGVPYKVEAERGAILVLADKVSEVKLQLAAKGLPKEHKPEGYEILDKDQPLGASKSVEAVRFQRVLEGEIARTIMTIQSVKAAKVLLAIPVQSVFVRDRKKPSASVMVNLYKGRTLDKGQVDSIVHLVAASVPQLEAEQVTVVDQEGHLLNIKEPADGNLTTKQFEFKKDIEEHLMARITNILSPIVGSNGMRAQISADVDFTETDKTQEMFNPDLPAIRSEQTSEEQNSLGKAQGVPGALSNQPTPAGTAPETLDAAGQNTDGKSASVAKTATRNFELDKTITHMKMATGLLRRLSVAVVVDDKHLAQADGTMKFQPYAQEDINRFTELVKQAVGFDGSRGDQVTVSNVTFKIPDELEIIPELPLWQQAWFLNIIKQVAAVLVVLFLVFGILRPTMRRLGGKSEAEIRAELLVKAETEAQAAAVARAAEIGGEVQYDENGIPIAVADINDPNSKLALEFDPLLLDMPQSYEHRLEYVKRLIDDDPQIVAQVIKSWIRKDG